MEMILISKRNSDEFERVRHEIDRVVKRACHGEFSTDDVKERVEDGAAFVACVLDGDDCSLACVWEMVYYPQMTAVNVMCLGGRKMKETWRKFGHLMIELWKSQGASVFECSTSLPMVKLIKKAGIPLEPVYVVSRGRL